MPFLLLRLTRYFRLRLAGWRLPLAVAVLGEAYDEWQVSDRRYL